MLTKKQFSARDKQFEVRAVRVPEGIVARAFDDEGNYASEAYTVSAEMAHDIAATGAGDALSILMDVVEADVIADRASALKAAVEALDGGD